MNFSEDLSLSKYADHKWSSILDDNNFSQNLKDMLVMEQKFMLEVIDDNQYDVIIELGCGKGLLNSFYNIIKFNDYFNLKVKMQFFCACNDPKFITLVWMLTKYSLNKLQK